jgi:hypothetical protein
MFRYDWRLFLLLRGFAGLGRFRWFRRRGLYLEKQKEGQEYRGNHLIVPILIEFTESIERLA